jgi:hypothetical protein
MLRRSTTVRSPQQLATLRVFHGCGQARLSIPTNKQLRRLLLHRYPVSPGIRHRSLLCMLHDNLRRRRCRTVAAVGLWFVRIVLEEAFRQLAPFGCQTASYDASKHLASLELPRKGFGKSSSTNDTLTQSAIRNPQSAIRNPLILRIRCSASHRARRRSGWRR